VVVRGKYGIEYFPKSPEEKSGALGCVVAAVVLLVVISLGWTLISRIGKKETPEKAPASPTVEVSEPHVQKKEQNPPQVSSSSIVESRSEKRGVLDKSIEKRPPEARNLLMRLSEAERKADVKMSVSTIEALRALPGSPVADLDDYLARRLGDLNFKMLFTLRSAQWVKTVTVRRGDYATRIAAENGSTFSSLVRLNDKDVSKLKIGQKVNVMNHPRFRLVLHKRSKLADLSLNGKFFKRYDISGVTAPPDTYEVSIPLRKFWASTGAGFSAADRAEIEMLLPKGAPVIVSEL
jgi:LysM repeat protein